MKPTDISAPDYFHKVVDCQGACPAPTPVPEYIRLIAAGRYTDAYMVNWESNVFPGILGRTCDRPCEPACRRGRVEEAQLAKPEPVAICRLKRVAADYKDDNIENRMPRPAVQKNGKRIACIGAGPASLTVARDLAPLGYQVTVFDADPKAGGMIRSQIPRFRLPEEVIDEETGYVLRLGVDVKVIVRSPFDEMKASPWEKEDAIHEGIPILDCLVPKAFLHDNGKLTGVRFEKVKAVRDERGRRQLVPTGEPEQVFECDEVLVAVGQENAFPWIERNVGIEFDEHGMPKLDAVTLQSSRPDVFFGGDAALGPKNIIWAVAQGHAAAISIDKFLHGEPVAERPALGVTLVSQKMGIHEWSYDNEVAPDTRHKVPWRDVNQVLRNIKVEVELGFDVKTAWKEAQRCLNCDVQTVFTTSQCIECDACVDICPVDCITFTKNGAEPDLRTRLRAPARNADQALYVADNLKTGNVMVKDEDVCLHCGLCAERCPTGAWDMQKFTISQTRAGSGCRNAAPKKAVALT